MVFTNSLSDAAMECMKRQVNCLLSYKGSMFVILMQSLPYIGGPTVK